MYNVYTCIYYVCMHLLEVAFQVPVHVCVLCLLYIVYVKCLHIVHVYTHNYHACIYP